MKKLKTKECAIAMYGDIELLNDALALIAESYRAFELKQINTEGNNFSLVITIKKEIKND